MQLANTTPILFLQSALAALQVNSRCWLRNMAVLIAQLVLSVQLLVLSSASIARTVPTTLTLARQLAPCALWANSVEPASYLAVTVTPVLSKTRLDKVSASSASLANSVVLAGTPAKNALQVPTKFTPAKLLV